MQTKRTVFGSPVLPYLLVLPQMAITIIFFLWPAGQAVWQSFLREDPFGLKTSFIWFANYQKLFADPGYLYALQITAVFAISVAVLSIGTALILAVAADRMVKSAQAYTTLLVWPYAVAPAVAGVMWWFMFNPTIGILSYMLKMMGYDWNHSLNTTDAMILVVIAASWKQVSYNFPVLPGRTAIHSGLAQRSGGHRRRRPGQALLHHRPAASVADDLLSRRGQHGLRHVRHLRRHPRHDPGRTVTIDGDPCLQGVPGRFHRIEARLLGGPVRRSHGHRHRFDRHPVPLGRTARGILGEA